jgi:predicted nucleotidyltransferase
MYKKTKADQVPKRARKSESRFEHTEEWRLMKADIDRGLKPQEALQAVLTPEDKKKYKIKNRRTIARFIKKYLESKGLKYGVKSFNKDGADYIVVQHTPVVRQIA